LEASSIQPNKVVGYYDWWALQMLLHFKIVLASYPGNFGIGDAMRHARFDRLGRPAKDLASPWDCICMEVVRLLERLKRGAKSYADMKTMYDALVMNNQPPHILVGPGDSFVKGSGCAGKEIRWDFAGPGGGLMWVEGLTIPARGGKKQDDFTLTEAEKRLSEVLKSERAQLAICNSETDFNFYANSPFYFNESIESELPKRFSGYEVKDPLMKLAKVGGSDPIMLGSWDLMRACLDSGRLILRPNPSILEGLQWHKAYYRVMEA
jgi:hypothetical protein